MARILLINPPSPEQMGSPLLGLQYVAVALLQKGCEVRVIDAAARYSDRDPATNRFYRHYIDDRNLEKCTCKSCSDDGPPAVS